VGLIWAPLDLSGASDGVEVPNRAPCRRVLHRASDDVWRMAFEGRATNLGLDVGVVGSRDCDLQRTELPDFKEVM